MFPKIPPSVMLEPLSFFGGFALSKKFVVGAKILDCRTDKVAGTTFESTLFGESLARGVALGVSNG